MRVIISGVGQKAEGIATADGQRIFIPGALPGETVDLDDGTVSQIVSPSPERIEPVCAHFGRCGGCQTQHWHDAPYRAWKRNLVQSVLAAHGIAAEVAPLVDAHGAGRRRAVFHGRMVDGKALAGFMAARSHVIEDISHCAVLTPPLAAAPEIARAIAALAGTCDVLVTETDGGLDVAVKAGRELKQTLATGLARLAASRGLARVCLNGEVVVEHRQPLLRMGAALVKLPPWSFLQATSAAETMLAEFAVSHLAKAKHVADLFCGIGPFALRLAPQVRVTAVDSDHAAIAALAGAVKTTQGLKPVTADTRDLFRAPLTARELEEFDAVVIDPPRAGAEAQCHHLAKSKVKRIAMISCDARTFARDLKNLTEGGYRIERVVPVDQFRFTPHVELFAALLR